MNGDTPNYTPEQSEICSLILSKENYYEILSVERSAGLEEIKKSYKRLALKLHPDKNRHPKSHDAFKAINKAFVCLSDEEKRRRYDLTGTEDQTPQMNNRYTSDEDIAEELFRHFFGESFYRPNAHFQVFRNRQQQRGPQENGNVYRLLPVIILLFISILSSVDFTSMPYSLSQTNKHTIRLTTERHNVPYWVENSYIRELTPKDRRNLDQNVESYYSEVLRTNCNKKRREKENLE